MSNYRKKNVLGKQKNEEWEKVRVSKEENCFTTNRVRQIKRGCGAQNSLEYSGF